MTLPTPLLTKAQSPLSAKDWVRGREQASFLSNQFQDSPVLSFVLFCFNGLNWGPVGGGEIILRLSISPCVFRFAPAIQHRGVVKILHVGAGRASIVNKFDGSLKGEHGTGRNIAPFVELEWGAEAVAIMRRIKVRVGQRVPRGCRRATMQIVEKVLQAVSPLR